MSANLKKNCKHTHVSKTVYNNVMLCVYDYQHSDIPICVLIPVNFD